MAKNPRAVLTTGDTTLAASANLTAKTSPTSSDVAIIFDAAAGNALKKATFANISKAVAGTLAGIEATNGLTASSGVLTVAAKVAHLEASLLKGITGINMSFETGEQTISRVYFPYAVTIDKIRGTLMKACSGTDDGTVTGANSTGSSANGVITCSASAVIDTRYSVSPTTNNTVAADSYYQLTTAKTTAGGKIYVTLEWHRT
jgi:hypothetical protein